MRAAAYYDADMPRSLRTGATPPIAVRLPADTLERLDTVAEEQGLSRSELIRQAIDQRIAKDAA
ncbi:MAG: CopG family ribbon-helix-helix protein [Phycisphaerales bacterium]